jgi:hypothetical protein
MKTTRHEGAQQTKVGQMATLLTVTEGDVRGVLSHERKFARGCGSNFWEHPLIWSLRLKLASFMVLILCLRADHARTMAGRWTKSSMPDRVRLSFTTRRLVRLSWWGLTHSRRATSWRKIGYRSQERIRKASNVTKKDRKVLSGVNHGGYWQVDKKARQNDRRGKRISTSLSSIEQMIRKHGLAKKEFEQRSSSVAATSSAEKQQLVMISSFVYAISRWVIGKL